jgi:hypothetical protein
MSRYGEAMEGDALLAEFKAEDEGLYEFKLYPQLWKSEELASYYKDRKWDVVKFTDPPPPLPEVSGIYMFVVGPYCGGIKDHSYIFYVGKTKCIRKRYSEYLREKAGIGDNPRKEIVMFLNDFESYIYFHFTQVPEGELDRAERLLKDNLTPVANTQISVRGRLTTS